AAGDDLVRIGLVADVPDQFVDRRVEHIMKRDRQLDHAERRAQMPAGYRHRRNDFLAKLVGELRQLLLGEAAQVGGKMHRVEQRRFGTVTHRRGLNPYSALAKVEAGQSPQSPQVPRTSITGRGAEKPALLAASRTPLVRLSSSMCTACPQLSQMRKMQSWRQAGCRLAI